ncbi:MAG TPA: hypothetical protein VGS79_24855 [Puia sp.]|nr:hypothetical protein [Puia sp.]
MPKLILPILVMLFLSSCVTYQYFTVDSAQLPKDDHQAFVADNDTMQIAYSFGGAGGPLTITIFNKTNQMLTINWNKSALICNDQSFSLAQTNSTFTASALTGRGTGSTTVSGTVNVVPGVQIIPPQTRVVQPALTLNVALPQFKMALPDTARKQRVMTDNAYEISFKTVAVNESQSPLRMKSYLDFTIGQGSGTEFVESHTFYVSKMMQSTYSPDQFSFYHQLGNEFYIASQNN